MRFCIDKVMGKLSQYPVPNNQSSLRSLLHTCTHTLVLQQLCSFICNLSESVWPWDLFTNHEYFPPLAFNCKLLFVWFCLNWLYKFAKSKDKFTVGENINNWRKYYFTYGNMNNYLKYHLLRFSSSPDKVVGGFLRLFQMVSVTTSWKKYFSHAPQLLSLCSRAHEPQLLKPTHLELVLHSKRSHRYEKPIHGKDE